VNSSSVKIGSSYATKPKYQSKVMSHSFQYSLYSVFVLLLECREWSPLAYAVGHTAVFTVNAALVASQWQHLAWTIPCTHPLTLALYKTSCACQRCIFHLLLIWDKKDLHIILRNWINHARYYYTHLFPISLLFSFNHVWLVFWQFRLLRILSKCWISW